MADELTLNASLAYDDGDGFTELLAIADLLANVSTKATNKFKLSVGTSEEAIPLGDCTAPGWAILVNLDDTNYVDVKVATSGAIFARLLPGEFCLLRLGGGAQVPYWIAHTGACLCKGLIIGT